VAILAQELAAKRVELLKETLPTLRVVAVLHETTFGGLGSLSETQAAVRTLNLRLVSMKADSAAEIEPALQTAARRRVDALLVLSSALFNAERERVTRVAARHRLPAMYEHRDFPDAGGLMSYGPDIHGIFRRVAGYVDRILKGAAPADLPVEQPTRLELVVNLRTAKALGLTIPPSVLLRADQVIQ
jgi:putative ABC transport system substrate-binding protein